MSLDNKAQYVCGEFFFDGVRNDIAKLNNASSFDVISEIASKYDAILCSDELGKELFLNFGRSKTICLRALMSENVLLYEMLKKLCGEKNIKVLNNYFDICDDFRQTLNAMVAIETAEM